MGGGWEGYYLLCYFGTTYLSYAQIDIRYAVSMKQTGEGNMHK